MNEIEKEKWLQRLVIEAEEVEQRLYMLNCFMINQKTGKESKAFKELDTENRVQLHRQQVFMEGYKNTLRNRIYLNS